MRSIIEVKAISKRYPIGVARGRYGNLRESIAASLRAPLRLTHRGGESSIWALKDVTFDIAPGEVVGIIGRNGAGKSTLLKVLSRITEPTAGEIRLYGRVASLLEVGTGFHPELTGRENVYLNGAILGMRKKEIDKTFDQIASFAEVDRFLDSPVKHYSSGMYVRLAFAVAAHLETEILVIDEVLAVGDARFQKKCLGRLGEVARSGRTVLFVSHNMGAIRAFCPKAMLLDDGRVTEFGDSSHVVRRYLDDKARSTVVADRDLKGLARTKGNGVVRVTRASIGTVSGEPSTEFCMWEPIAITIMAEARDDVASSSFWILVYSAQGDVVLSSFQYDVLDLVRVSQTGIMARVILEPLGLVPGRYFVSVGAFGRHNEFFDWVDSALTFEVRNELMSGRPFDYRLGVFSLPYRWEVTQ